MRDAGTRPHPQTLTLSWGMEGASRGGRKGMGRVFWEEAAGEGAGLHPGRCSQLNDIQVMHERLERWHGGERGAAGGGLLTGRGVLPTKQLQCPPDLGGCVSSEHLSSQSRLERH